YIYLGGEPLVILGPEHAATVAGGGWSKNDFKRALWERAQVPLARFDPSNIERFAVIHPAGFKDRPPQTLVPLAREWSDILSVAAAAFGRAVEMKPAYPEAWNGLGHALRNQGKYPESLKAYDEALRLRPDYPDALEYLGEAYVKLGRLDDARRVLERLKPLDG